MVRLVTASFAILLVTAALLGSVVSARAGETVLLREGPAPALLVVPAGTTVTWRNVDEHRHRIRSEDGPREFDSGNLEPGESFSLRLTLPGRYRYLDERREDEDEDERDRAEAVARGTIVVRAPAASPVSTARLATATPATSDVVTASAPSPASAATTGSMPLDAAPSGAVAIGSPAASGVGTPIDASPAAQPTPRAVAIEARAYAPADVSITAGETVQWSNRDGEGHTVTAVDGSFDSGLMAGGMTYARTFEAPGTFEYGCTIHPEMRGRVIVSAPLPDDAQALPVGPPPPSPDLDAAAGGASISLVDVTYQPAVLEVVSGASVSWTNDDPVVHTVTARDGSFNSGVMRPGEAYSLVFETPGTYDYFCAIHPGQAGSVVVTASGD